ncbi:hypothetical protein SSAG_04751 [Streptomyces sp. Mg1]|nr:hypothetical protein SSAG_04751 [Streptomyces sp. Mg1]
MVMPPRMKSGREGAEMDNTFPAAAAGRIPRGAKNRRARPLSARASAAKRHPASARPAGGPRRGRSEGAIAPPPALRPRPSRGP